jgi:hypothetical protein
VPATPEPLSHEERSFASRIPSAYILEGVEDAVGPVAEASRQYLVWRDDHGTLGFGNVDYPDEETLGICTDGQWFNVKKVQQKPTVPAEPQYIALGSQRTFFGVAIRE